MKIYLRLTAATLVAGVSMFATPSSSLAATLEYSEFGGQVQLLSELTSYGQGEVRCPVDMFALGGGSHCTDGDLDISYPIQQHRDGNWVPVGWREHHRGNSSNDCKVFSVCAPSDWFGRDQIRVVRRRTHYGQGSVNCPRDYRAISGGSFCTDGDLDTAYPNSNLTGWNEWHRGASSYDCEVYAVCVSTDHWIGQTANLVSRRTGYGQGHVECRGGDIAVGGGAYCYDGDLDVNYPLEEMTGWAEHHRGASSNDCVVYGVCLPRAGFERNLPGESCGLNNVFDCNLECVDRDTAQRHMADDRCDNGRWGINLVCEAFDNDSGACPE